MEDNTIRWTGSYGGSNVTAALPIDNERCVILLDRTANKQEVFENLLCVDSSGTVVWKADLPEKPDVFVKIAIAGGVLRAWTWSCWMLKLEPQSGKVIEKQFVK
jgi:outer membrane protein assembly factor BamB